MENKYSKKYIIETGMGLQDVDHLKNSSYFVDESKKYIKGEISLEELEKIIDSYYKNKPKEEERTEEADKTSIRIAQLIEDDSFVFSIGQLVSIHEHLFKGVYAHAGEFRTYNFTKQEWVLDGASVFYADHRLLKTTLQYDFDSEREFEYLGLSIDEIIAHLAGFISNIWQVHPFEESNTRTTAVFVIKYLRSIGFRATNDTFAKNAWYFRNALVRANYRNIHKHVYEDKSFLVRFLRNLLLDESNDLRNKDLHISKSSRTILPYKESTVLELIKSNPTIRLKEIADAIKVSPRTVDSLVASLVGKGLIQRVGGKKSGHWEVK